MNDFWLWAQGSICYEQLTFTDDMSYSRLWAQGFRCYEQLRVVVDMNDSRSWTQSSWWLWTRILARCVPTRLAILAVHLFGENIYFLEKTWSRHLFLFYFFRKNKIRKKTLSMTPYLKKTVCEKPKLGWGLGYLLGRYGIDHSTPLSP